MSVISIDSSILIAAMIADEPVHEECARLLDVGGVCFYTHGVSETFSTLTGGRRQHRLSANVAVDLLEHDFLPGIKTVSLTPAEMLRAMQECQMRGVRGGAIYDYLHLVAARKAGATRFYTLNVSDFESFARAGDPKIVHP